MLQPSPSPTRVRHLVVFSTAMVATILYLDRFCISMAELYIKQDLELTDVQVGWMLSAFFWSYALAQVPSGWFSDRFGGRLMLTIYVLGWSLFTGLTGLATGFAAILGIRLLFGVFQAGAYPTSASLVSKWAPFANRGTASSLIAFGGRLGGGLAMLVTALLIARFVPTSVSSELSAGDLLRAPEFCFGLQQAKTPSGPLTKGEETDETKFAERETARRILKLFSQESQQIVRTAAEKYQEKLNAKNDGKSANEQSNRLSQKEMAGFLPESHRDLLETDLNKIINAADFYRAKDFDHLELPYEAKRYKQTLDKNESLKAPELSRLNRLLLESAYPNHFKRMYIAGWRPVMWLYGILGLVVAGLYWFCLRDRPRDHPRCNEQEIAVIESGRPPEATRPDGKVGMVPLGRLIKSKSMWLICISQFFTNVGWIFLLTWAPRFLVERHHIPVEMRGWMAATPIVIGMLGMLAGGRLTDLLSRKIGLRWGRALPMSLSRFVAMAAYLFCLTDPQNPWILVAAFSVVAFSTDLGAGAVWAFKQDVGGRYVGSILGWGNMWGNLGAAIAAPALIAIAGEIPHRRWDYVFITCAAAFFLSGIAALGVNATIPIAPPDEEEQADGDEKKDE